MSLSDISHLPPRLTQLELINTAWSPVLLEDGLSRGIDVSVLWPKTLQILIIGPECNSDDMKQLPTTLTSLTIEFNNRHSVIQLESSYFPPNLTYCNFTTSYPASIAFVGGNLPSTLQRLGADPQSELDTFTRATIEEKLPSSLTDLSFAMPDHPTPDDTPWTLPSQLVTLNMKSWRAEWLAALPRQLTSLTISELWGVPKAFAVGSFDLFEHLSTILTYLCIDLNGNEDRVTLSTCVLEVPSLASLTHLRHLKCSPFLRFAPFTLSYIPKSLRHLHVNMPDAGDQIPSWLHYCSLGTPGEFKSNNLN